MADYGLAAQIGRGGGAGGMPQQQDPQNRMLQLMQLQQLQQNMMLAREQEARQAQLFGPQLEGKRLENVTEGLRQTVLGNQGRETGAKASSAEDALFGQRGVMKYISETPKELIADPKNLDVLRRTNAPAYTVITQMIAEKDALEAKAKAEGYTAGQKRLEQQAMARRNMFSLLPAVTDQRSYDTLYSEYEGVDPIGAKLIGREFNPKNMTALSSRLMALDESEVKEDAFGRPYRLFKRTGQTEFLPSPQPAGTGANTNLYGDLTQPLANPPVSPQMAGGPAASALVSPNVMQPPGAAPQIIDQSARMPAAPALSPKAEAQRQQTTAVETAKSAVVSEDRRRGAADVLKAISDPKLDKLIMGSTSGRGERFAAEIPAFFGISTSGMEKIGQLGTIESQITTQILGGKLGSGISNADVNLIREGVGQISNPNVPANQRLAALKQLRNNLKALSEGKEIAIAEPGSGAALKLSPDVDALLKKYQ